MEEVEDKGCSILLIDYIVACNGKKLIKVHQSSMYDNEGGESQGYKVGEFFNHFRLYETATNVPIDLSEYS